MRYIVCASCEEALAISGLGFSPDVLFGQTARYGGGAYRCFRCGGEATLCKLLPGGLKGVHEVTEEEAFRAINGLGLPFEQ